MPRRLLTMLAVVVAVGVASAAGASAPAAAAPVSSAAQIFTCCTDAALQERLFSEAEASGAEYVRVDVELHGIFGSAGGADPDWSRLDATVERARRHHLRVLGILRGSPPWLSTCPDRASEVSICPPRDPVEWGRLAGEVAAHARASVDRWEILNEPDARWAFLGSPEEYARMLSAAHDAIKAAAPDAQVVFGGVERPRERAWIDRVLATPGADAANKFDIAAVHLRLRLRNRLPELGEWLRSWRKLLAQHGFQGPTWVTEHGYPADPRFQWDPSFRGAGATGAAAQAALLEQSIPLLARAGADQVFVTLRDNLYGEFLSEGLVRVDDTAPGDPATRRLAFTTARELALTWDESLYRRSGAADQAATARDLSARAQRSAGKANAVAAAIQAGAAEGHWLAALDLERAAR